MFSTNLKKIIYIGVFTSSFKTQVYLPEVMAIFFLNKVN